MVKATFLSALPVLMLAEQALGFGCSTHSYTTCDDNIVHWFDPDDGMICDPLDCGGGRAPVKTGVPGCANYSGTETRGTSYLSCWKPSTTLATASAVPTTEVPTPDAEPTSTAIEVETHTSIKSHASAEESTRIVEATITENTTVAPVLPTQTQTTTETEATEATKEPAATPSVIPNAAQAAKGSLIAVAGVAMGVFLLL
jgi:hypothetical protein